MEVSRACCRRVYLQYCTAHLLLRTISHVISERALENGGFFFTAGPSQRSKSSFRRNAANCRLSTSFLRSLVGNKVSVKIVTQKRNSLALLYWRSRYFSEENLSGYTCYIHVVLFPSFVSLYSTCSNTLSFDLPFSTHNTFPHCRILRSGRNVSRKSCMLIFDDGFGFLDWRSLYPGRT